MFFFLSFPYNKVIYSHRSRVCSFSLLILFFFFTFSLQTSLERVEFSHLVKCSIDKTYSSGFNLCHFLFFILTLPSSSSSIVAS